MSEPRVEITGAAAAQLPALAAVFGRAFVTEPMLRWPLGEPADVVERCTRCFAYFLEEALELGIVWTTTGAEAAAAWVPPAAAASWDRHPWNQPRIRALNDDGGRRYDAFWDWVYSHDPDEELWQLDSIAVEPESQGRGLGRALIEFGLERARSSGAGAFLSTGTPRNVGIYERFGFRVTDDADAPGAGPHIWFMRWEP
jgi:GNAT superfamily N-acetyltransferase